MHKTIAIIGVPWSTHELEPAVRDAAHIGAKLVLVDQSECLESVDAGLELTKLPVERMTPDCVARALKPLGVDAVVAITELMLILAAEVREAMALPGTPSSVERSISNKAATRKVLSAHGMTAVRQWETTLGALQDTLADVQLPVVLKPLDLTGSVGVRLIGDLREASDLDDQYDLSEAKRFGRDRIVLESFISGVEISVEGLCVDGQVTVWAMTDKINTGAPHFVEIGHVMPSRLTGEWLERVGSYVQGVAQALGVVTSPIHAELMLSDTGIELVEFHSRFGGDNIVRLLAEICSHPPYVTYFAALLGEHVALAASSDTTWGVGFFTAPSDGAAPWKSFDFPHPGAIREIEFDACKPPKVTRYEGVKLLYRRLGCVLAASRQYEDVSENIGFLAHGDYGE